MTGQTTEQTPRTTTSTPGQTPRTRTTTSTPEQIPRRTTSIPTSTPTPIDNAIKNIYDKKIQVIEYNIHN